MKTQELYEKLYFHELEQREKIVSRLQLPLAVIIALVGFLGFLLTSVENLSKTLASSLFWIMYILAAILLGLAIYKFIRALWGNTYKCLPTAKESDDYLNLLKQTYKEYEDGQEISEMHFENYVTTYFRDCSSENTQVNDIRFLRIHESISYIIMTLLASSVAFGSFYFGNLEKIQTAEANKIFIESPVSVEIIKMPEDEVPITPSNQAPPPPSPPPKRVIKENAPIPGKPAKPEHED